MIIGTKPVPGDTSLAYGSARPRANEGDGALYGLPLGYVRLMFGDDLVPDHDRPAAEAPPHTTTA